MPVRHAWTVLTLLFLFASTAPAGAGELAEQDELAREVQDLVWGEQFDKLEAMADTFRAQGTRSASGLWRLSHFNAGLSKFLDSCAMSCEGILARWQARYPASPNPWLARTEHFILLAWEHRGSGSSDTVDEESWKPFFDNIAKARQVLEEHKNIASQDPRWYSMMLTVARAQGWSAADVSALIDEGLDRTPLYYPIYFNAVEYYMPRWYGDAAAIETFARAAVDRTRASEGLGLYARIYWYAAEAYYYDNVFAASDVDWNEMKRGFDDVLAQYPDNWNLNHYAKFACVAGDSTKMLELIDRIEGQVIEEAFAQAYLDACRAWAKQHPDASGG